MGDVLEKMKRRHSLVSFHLFRNVPSAAFKNRFAADPIAQEVLPMLADEDFFD